MEVVTQNGVILLREGKVAGGDGCCCGCACPDYCMYQIEVVSPLAFGPFPTEACGFPSSASVSGETPLWQNATSQLNFSDGLYARFSFLDGVKSSASTCSDPVPSSGGLLVDKTVSAFADIYVYCSGNTLLATIELQIYIQIGGLIWRRLRKHATVELASLCSQKSNATCGASDAPKANYLSGVPIQITVSDSSPGVGIWDEPPLVDEQIGEQASLADCFDYLRKNFSATFRITQRESCCPADLTCGDNCCTQEQTCCSNSCCDNVCCNGVCCPPGQLCVDGVCVDPCPPERECGEDCCEPDETCCNGECCDLTGCTWGENRFEIFSVPYDTSPCGAGVVPWTKQQTIYQGFGVVFFTPPVGVNWKSPIGSGGPGATLNGCQYAVVVNEVYSGCYVSYELDGTTQDLCWGGDVRSEIKVLRVDCNGTVSDVTDDVLEGDIYKDRYYVGIAGTGCTNPAAPPFLDFYPDPEFFCPP